MVVSNYPYWPRILRQIGKLLATIFVLSILSIVLDIHHLLRNITIPDIAVSVLGAALSILLAFRTNSAYARWWEARTLWGGLVNSSRSLARQVISFSRDSQAFSRAFVYRQIAFVHATRCALRRQPPWEEISPFLDAADLSSLRSAQNVPAALLQQMGEQLVSGLSGKLLSDWEMQRIDSTLSDLANILGACERIKNTPLPRQYDYYPELLIKVYCVVLPFVIVDEVGLLTPFVTLLLAFAFLVLNRVGKNLEDPFENQPYDVPLTALSRTIEINLRQALGENIVPEQVVPVNGVLM